MAPRCTALYIFIVTMTAGCGGAEFSVFDRMEADGGTPLVDAPDSAPATSDSGTGGAGGATATGGAPTEIDGGAAGASGGSLSTGGELGSGGTSSGGTAGTGGTGGAGTGGMPSTGGTAGSGGVTATGGVTGCTKVTHSNGIGQTWEDCVALDTFDESQATKACVAHTGDAQHCYVSGGCGGVTLGIVRTDSSTDSYFWVYAGTLTGNVSDKGCVPDRAWN